MPVKSCCFTGHRPKALPWKNDENDLRCAALKSKIRIAAENLIVERGCEKFISGMARGADIICAEVVLALKNIYPHIDLECAVPNRIFAKSWPEAELRRYTSILDRAGNIKFISEKEVYNIRDFMRRNIYMVDSSDIVIAVYTEGKSGGTENTVKYAKAQNKEIIIIDPDAI
ncbi:MAG: DUF1273 domain-containing protein [Oscillospiraceae bacterium]|nr:DUF1273 domain-containing protein [Oscillospiraceae bacterium]